MEKISIYKLNFYAKSVFIFLYAWTILIVQTIYARLNRYGMRSRIVYMSNIISWRLYRYAFQNMEHKRKNIPIFHSIQSTHLMYNSLSDQWGVTDFVLQVPFICISKIVVYTEQTKCIIILFSPFPIPTKKDSSVFKRNDGDFCCYNNIHLSNDYKHAFSFYDL